MRRVTSGVACCAIVLAGCRHASPEERVQKLLYQSDESGPTGGESGRRFPQPAPTRLQPEQIHGGII